MAKTCKLRISKIITTTFQSCRSKDPSTLPKDPVPSFFRFSPVNPKLLTVDHNHFAKSPQNSRPSSIRRHESSAFRTKDSLEPAATKDSDDHCTRSSSKEEFSWKKEEKWHVVAKIYDDKNRTPCQKIYNSDVKPPPTSKKKLRAKKKKAPARLRVSCSSAESGLFSIGGGEATILDEEEENLIETETLIYSSRSFSFSSDNDSSSEFNPHPENIRERPPITRRQRHKWSRRKKNTTKKQLLKRSVANESPARLSVFKKLIPCSLDGKVKESFAIVKKSEDPYEDFKRSMMEMILEKQMFEERDLERLLQCFLSLNSRHYRPLIIQVFAEIWEAMFCASDDPSSVRHHYHHRRCVNSRNTNEV